jgi:hypothetical protein
LSLVALAACRGASAIAVTKRIACLVAAVVVAAVHLQRSKAYRALWLRVSLQACVDYRLPVTLLLLLLQTLVLLFRDHGCLLVSHCETNLIMWWRFRTARLAAGGALHGCR